MLPSLRGEISARMYDIPCSFPPSPKPARFPLGSRAAADYIIIKLPGVLLGFVYMHTIYLLCAIQSFI
ncbi:hypothetical protein Mpsy_2470 [Methanolobus psychrophilus R15]|nr:hypothetical protein Mpsy_2470 [Methanolobus psychrophilus R15]